MMLDFCQANESPRTKLPCKKTSAPPEATRPKITICHDGYQSEPTVSESLKATKKQQTRRSRSSSIDKRFELDTTPKKTSGKAKLELRKDTLGTPASKNSAFLFQNARQTRQ